MRKRASNVCLTIVFLCPLILLSIGGILAASTLGEGTEIYMLVVAKCNSTDSHEALALMSGSSFCAYNLSQSSCHSGGKSSFSYACDTYSSCVKVPPPSGVFTDALIAAGARSDSAATVQVAAVFSAIIFPSAFLRLKFGEWTKRTLLLYFLVILAPFAPIASSINLLLADGLLERAAAKWARSDELAGACGYQVPVKVLISEVRAASGAWGIGLWLPFAFLTFSFLRCHWLDSAKARAQQQQQPQQDAQ